MRIIDILNSPWAIQPEKLQEIVEIYSRHMKGPKIDIKSIEAKAGVSFDNRPEGYEIVDGVAVIPVQGIIAKKMNLFHQISGGISTELLGRDIEHSLDNDDVHSIILDIDSPGGTVDGTEDLGELIFNARERKPIVGLANGLIASGAYWIGSAASKLYIANNTTEVGSIGVVATHYDYSKANEKQGVAITEIYAGKFKRIASENKPLTKEGRQSIQDRIDYLYSIFVDTVARNRGVDSVTVLDNMADGRLFIGQQAIDAGLVDGVSTMTALIEQLNSNVVSKTTNSSDSNVVYSYEGTINIGAGLSADEATKVIEILENEQKENDMDPKDVTKGYILDKHSDIADAFREEGIASVDQSEIAAKAKQAECERIKSVMDQSMPGHEDLIKEKAFDGKTTGPETAVAILKAEKASGSQFSSNLKADTDDIPNVSTSNDTPADDPNMPFDKRCKLNWDKSPTVRAEFNDDYDSYFAYEKADKEGLIKTLGGKR